MERIGALIGTSWGRVLGASSLLEATFVGLGGVRHKITQPRGKVQKLQEDGVGVKFHGFTYFPRFPDQVDPPYEPTKLFAVRRVKSLKAKPYWERRIMEQDLKLQSRRSVAVVKNTPTTNAMLYKVKHLIEITPITCPDGLPDDPSKAFLKENGELVVYNKLATHGNVELKDFEEDVNELRKRSVDTGTMKRRLNLNWYRRL